MDYFLAFVLATVGIACFVWYKRFSQEVASFYAKRSRETFGNLRNWDNQKYLIVFKVGVLLFGVSLLIMAFHFAFGTIYIGSAQPPGTLPPDVSTAAQADHCALIMPTAESQALIDRLDRSETSFASTTQDVMGQSTEGGTQTTYTQDGVRQIVEQRFYGETGRSVARIYYTSGKPFALIVQGMKYAVPLSVDNNGNVKSVEERDYFLDENGVVCSWTLNGKPQPIDSNTIESVKTYLTGVL